MLQFKGIVERDINGKKVFFKFNMASLTMLGDLQKISFQELGLELGSPKLSTIVNFLYAAAAVYDRQDKPKVPQNFSQDDAAELVAEMGFADALSLLNNAFDAPEIKNDDAPK